MSAITQTIPNYVFGISQQPDILKQPGQVVDSVNCTPDITAGLIKRPGGRFIANINDNDDGKWLSYYRTPQEQYLGHIQPNGFVRMWNITDGTACAVTQLNDVNGNPVTATSTTDNYFEHTDRQDIQTCTINDFTFVTNRGTETVGAQILPRQQPQLVGGRIDREGAGCDVGIKPLYPVTSDEPGTANQYKALPVSVTQFNVPDDEPAPEDLLVDLCIETVDIFVEGAANTTRNEVISIAFAANLTNAAATGLQYDDDGTIETDGTFENVPVTLVTGCTRADKELIREQLTVDFTLTAGALAANSVVLNRPGYAYEDGCTFTIDGLTQAGSNPVVAGHLVTRTELQGSVANPLRTLAVTTAGSGLTNGFLTNEATTALTGTGTGMTVDTVVQGQELAHATINAPGTNYNVGDTINVDNLANTVLTVQEQTVGARGIRWQNGDVFLVTAIDGELVGPDGPLFQIDDAAYGAPYKPAAWVELKVVAYGREYRVDFKNEDNELIAGCSVNTTATSTQVISARSDILDPLADLINNARPDDQQPASSPNNEVFGFHAEVIGNGIYVTFNQDFNVSVSDAQLMSAFTDEVNNVERLPFQCKDGYVVKITNASETDGDDYYAKFVGNVQADGEGAWNECVQPDIQVRFDASTMPHTIIATDVNTFVCREGEFTERTVGDEDTNPTPSFIDNGIINNIILFRSRVCYLSGEDLIATQTGGLDPIDFWSTSALATLPTDPLDISASSKRPAILYDAIEVNTGLIAFSENQQFLLATDAETLSQETAKFNTISYYAYDRRNEPISLGTSVAFVDNDGANFRMFEMFNFSREGEPTLTEPSIVVSRLTTDTCSYIADSRESTIVLFASEDERETVWGYRYFQDGNDRKQSAWFKWEMPGEVLYHCIIRDIYYAVVRIESASGVFTNQLVEHDVKTNDDTNFLPLNDRLFRIHMDNRVNIAALPAGSYDANTDLTTFPMPQNNGEDSIVTFNRRIFAYCVEALAPQQGVLRQVNVVGANLTVQGDWTGHPFQIGYIFTMTVELPQFYVTETSGNTTRSDFRASLTIHRFKINAGAAGTFSSTLNRLGKAPYIEQFEANTMNTYVANSPMLVPQWTQYIPVYERNTSVNVTLSSTHPSPFSLFSIAWEGDYSNKYYSQR